MTPTTPHQAIYRRWRAQTFAGIVGQEAVVETLRNAVRSGKVAHALLFAGPRGTGKTSLARIVAKAINCTDLRDAEPCDACPSCVAIREGRALDLVEIDAASNRGIDDIRSLRERMTIAPSDLRRKVFIFDEAHQITGPGWNALLKSLEEPPEFVVFMFASTHPQEFPPAVLSRVQRYDVRRLTVDEIAGKLRRILDVEGREADDDAVVLVARLAAGGMRDAESMLDQLLGTAGRLTARHVRDLLGLADEEVVARFVDALVTGNVATGLPVLDALDEHGRDPRAFLDQVVDAVRAELLAAMSSGDRPFARDRQAALVAAGRRLAAIDLSRSGPGGLRFQLELALLGAPAPAADRSASVPTRPASAAPAPAIPSAGEPASPPPGRRDATDAADPRAASQRRAAHPVDLPAPSGTSTGTATGTATGASPAPRSPRRPIAAPSPPVEQPAPSQPPAASPAPAPSAALEELIRGWPEVVAHVSENPAAKPLILACRPIAVDGNVVTLGFPESQAFLKDVAERKRADLERGVGRFLGRAVAVRCVAANIEAATELGGDAGGDLVAAARRIFGGDLADVDEVG